MKTTPKKGFTLIELLIVIGILSVLVVTILVTLNPSEAQKKARDAKRMKDLSTLQAIIEQYISDGNAPICTAAAGCQSSTALVPNTSIQSQTCTAANWIAGANVLCNYSNTIPLDPANGTTRTVIDGTGTFAAPGVAATALTAYELKMEGSDYEIRVRQESKTNAGNTWNDGGDDNGWAEAGSKLTLL